MACESETARLQQCDANQLHDLLLTARGELGRSKSKLASKDTRNPFFQNQDGSVFLNVARMPRRLDECLKSSWIRGHASKSPQAVNQATESSVSV